MNRTKLGPAAGLAALVTAAGILTACSSEELAEPDTTLERRMVLVAPEGAVSAALLDVSGVTAVRARGGDAVTRQVGGTLRALVLLDRPGELVLDVTLVQAGALPSGIVLQVADASDRPVERLDGFRLRVEP